MEEKETSYKGKTRSMYKVAEPMKLKSWEKAARKELTEYLKDEEYQRYVEENIMTGEFLGPFTKFLYHFPWLCEAPWGVLIDFNERKQRVFLPDHYYQWMHKLRDEIAEALEIIESQKQKEDGSEQTESGSGL